MILIPIRMNGSAAITMGTNCSTSATGLTPGVAASSWRASLARAASSSATGSRDDVCASASDSAWISATRASVGVRSDSASRVSNASVTSARDTSPVCGASASRAPKSFVASCWASGRTEAGRRFKAI